MNWRLFGGGTAAALSVTDVNRHLAGLIRMDDILQDLWVRGEVSNYTRAASGHWYFSLKDESGCLGCVMWRSAAARVPFRLEPGQQVLAHGQLDLYSPRGQYQLVVDDLQPDGVGAQYLALEQARRRLLAEGLLDEDRKRPLPDFPSRVAVVTSLSGAALRDICAIFATMQHPPALVLVPALVQGEGSIESLCAALALANRHSQADVILLARGGGSIEDLWSFNSESVARAIAASVLPVVTGVGHETDYTLADMVADLRAPTPTAAAERIVDQREELIRRQEVAWEAIQALFRAQAAQSRLRLEGLLRRAPLAYPEWLVAHRRQQLDELNTRLEHVRDRLLEHWRHRLALAAGRLEGISPLATLARGYASVLRLPEQEPVRSAAHLAPGAEVRVRLGDGHFDARVTRVESEEQRDV